MRTGGRSMDKQFSIEVPSDLVSRFMDARDRLFEERMDINRNFSALKLSDLIEVAEELGCHLTVSLKQNGND